MKIGISSFCWQCFKETDQTKEDYERIKNKLSPEADFEVELNDENMYEFVCPNGHKAVTQLQEQKFEILFDLAAMALLDGYTKEAASSLSSALERFIEYYILVICLKHNIPFENFINSWKQMANPLLELKENDIKFLQKALLFHIAKNGDKIPDTVLKANGSIPTIINLRSIQSPNFGSLTFRDALKSVKENSFYKKFYRKNLSEI